MTTGGFQSFGDSECTANDAAMETVSDLVQGVAPGGFVQRFVLLVEIVDEEDRWMAAYTAPAQKQWDSMGLLQWAMTVEAAAVTGSAIGDNE